MRNLIRFFLLIVALAVSNMASARDGEPVTQIQHQKKVAPAKNYSGRNYITGLSESAQNKIIRQMATALDSFATASLNIADDLEIETKLAIDSVHAMKKFALDDSKLFTTRLAIIHQMQTYIAYGLGYTPALLASSKLSKAGYDVAESPIIVFQQLLQHADLSFQRIEDPVRFNMKEFSELVFLSYQHVSFFFLCYNAFLPDDVVGYLTYDDKVKFVADFAAAKVDSLKKSPKMQFRAMSILEFPAFNWTYRPFQMAFCNQSSEVLQYMNYITVSDAFSRLLIDDAFMKMSDKEFEECLLLATEMKARVLRLITKRLLEIKEK